MPKQNINLQNIAWKTIKVKIQLSGQLKLLISAMPSQDNQFKLTRSNLRDPSSILYDKILTISMS